MKIIYIIDKQKCIHIFNFLFYLHNKRFTNINRHANEQAFYHTKLRMHFSLMNFNLWKFRLTNSNKTTQTILQPKKIQC